MSLLKCKTSPIDPSNFLWALKNKITKDHGSPFNFNNQQDVPEILQTVIDVLKGISQVVLSFHYNIISSTLQTLVISFHPLSKHWSLATLAFNVT